MLLWYALSMAGLFFLMKWLELKFIILDLALEVYVGIIALLFTGLGVWIALKLAKPKKELVIVQQETVVHPVAERPDRSEEIVRFGLSKRELEVLELMAAGMSNQQIAGSLFLSIHTIKTHVSKLFEKLEVQRRTQAIDKAKRLNLIG